MEEIELTVICELLLLHQLFKSVIFGEYSGEVALCDSVGHFGIGHNRLYGELFEAEIAYMQNIVCKIQIVLCERTSYIVVLCTSAGYQLLIFRNDYVVASLAVRSGADIIVYFFSSVKR